MPGLEQVRGASCGEGGEGGADRVDNGEAEGASGHDRAAQVQAGVEEGSFSDVAKLYTGRHDVYRATLAGRVCVLKEFSLAQQSDKKRLLKEVRRPAGSTRTRTR